MHLRDPDRGAEARGLDEDRVAERVFGLVALAQRDVRVTGISASRITALNLSLSIASAEPSTPAPT